MISKHTLQLASIATMATLAVTGCTLAGKGTIQSDAGAANEGVVVGASKTDYQKALADMTEVELNFQVSSTAASSLSGQRDKAFADAIEDWSGGKIKIDLVFANAIVPPDGISDALADGRLDLAHWLTSYHTAEMPAFVALQDALVAVPSSPLQGEIVAHFAAQEVAFDTPEIMEEFKSQGMTVLNPLNTFGATVLACTDEKKSLADFEGTQIRANAAAQVKQSSSIGASSVSLQLAETYEGLQRNVIQCTFGSPTTMVSNGWLEQAGNVYLPRDSSFVIGSGSIVAGASWEKLPLAAQQLIFDQMVVYNTGELGQAYAALSEGIKLTNETGSGMNYLEPEISAALAQGNEEILATVRGSSKLDGARLVNDVEVSAKKWAVISDELGYDNEGDFLDFPEWYKGNGSVIDDAYLGPIVERFYTEVLLPRRPA